MILINYICIHNFSLYLIAEGNNVIVIKNKKRYRCNGHIYKANCNGNLKEITTYFDDLSFCIAPFYKVVKNPLDNSLDYCIALTDNSISPKRNGVLECTDRNGNINNTLLISRNLYIKKCKTGIDEAALFTYYPDYKSKEFVELPSKFIKCFNGESKNSCTYLWNPRNVLFH